MILKRPSAQIFLLGSILCFLSISIAAQSTRERISINYDWRFFKGDPTDAKGIFYDVRPKVTDRNDNIIADTRANQTNTIVSDSGLKNGYFHPQMILLKIFPNIIDVLREIQAAMFLSCKTILMTANGSASICHMIGL